MSQLSEAKVLELLRARHMRPGNGGAGEFAFLMHVRNGAGFDASRTIDAVTVSLWPSRGLIIDGFEVKVSRSDWLRELKQPDKAEDASKVVDRFTLVAPRGIVKDGELPPPWGLLEVVEGKNGWRLVSAKAADILVTSAGEKLSCRPVSRAFLVGLLRSCPGAIPTDQPPPDPKEIRAVWKEGHKAGVEDEAEHAATWQASAKTLQEVIRTFESEAGVQLEHRKWLGNGHHPPDFERIQEVGAALRSVLQGDEHIARARRRLEDTARLFATEAARLGAAAGLQVIRAETTEVLP